MDENLLRKTSNWSLQEDEEVRESLEELRNNVSITSSKLSLNISAIKQKLLNTDCDIQQLNTQLALLKNIKYVEAGVEDEDSRPRPPLPVVIPTKEELIRITVAAVKETLKNIPNQLHCDRPPMAIESIPLFNDPGFFAFSIRPMHMKSADNRYERTKLVHHNEVGETSEIIVTEPLPLKPGPSLSRSEGPSAFIGKNGLPIRVAAEESSESEDENRKVGISQQIEQRVAPASLPVMGNQNGHIPKLPVSIKQRSLFSSDEDESDEKEIQPSMSTIAEEEPTTQVAKPRNDLMAQLAAKLKDKEGNIAVEKKKETSIKVEETLPQKTTKQSALAQTQIKENGNRSKTEVKTKVSSKIEEESRKAPIEPPLRQSSPPRPVVEKDLATNSQQTLINAPKVVTRREPIKKRGLFSDSDSDEDFIISKPNIAVTRPSVVKPKKPEPKKAEIKAAPKKSLPVKKSIFDSDSEEDSFSEYFKKSSIPAKKDAAPVTQKSVPAPSQGKAVKPEEPKQKISPPVTQRALPSGTNKQETSIEALLNTTKAAEPASSLIDPLSVARPKEDIVQVKPLISPKSQSPSEKGPVSTDLLGFSTETTEDSRPLLVSTESVEKTELSQSYTSSDISSIDIKPSQLPDIVDTNKVEDQTLSQLESQPAESFPPPIEEVPPVPELSSSRSNSPPEERESSEPLQQENLPPLPPQDPIDAEEETMPVGKIPGKLNNATFAAMLGSKLAAGPPGLRPPTAEAEDSANIFSQSAEKSSELKKENSSGSLSHLTKDRPRRAGIKRPTLHKTATDVQPKETKTKTTPTETNKDTIKNVTKSLSNMKITTSVAKETDSIKKEEKPETAKQASVKEALVENKTVTQPKPVVSNAASVKVFATISSTSDTAKLPPKKGFFDFSSSDEEPAPSTKITKSAATLKTTVTATIATKEVPTKTVSEAIKTKTSSSTSAAASISSATNKDSKTNARLNKYKNMFDQEDDFDVSLFKKST